MLRTSLRFVLRNLSRFPCGPGGSILNDRYWVSFARALICSRTTSVQSVQIDLFFDLTGELEVDDNDQVTGASIGLSDAGSDLPPMPA